MIHDSAARAAIAALAMSILTGAGCVTQSATEGAAPGADDLASTSPSDPDPDASARSSGPPCTSRLDASGLVCTTCRGDDRRAAPECLPAQCSVIDHCLRCVDPKGRVARDCSVDYENAPAASLGISPGDSFNVATCSFTWGIPAVSGTTCHYPGEHTCKVTTDAGGHCLSCTYSDGSAIQVCSALGDPLPDPTEGLPNDLPPPGHCSVDIGADGLVSCATCTRRDRSATRSCHHPGLVACELFGADDGLGTCTLQDGREVHVCNSPSGPAPVDGASCSTP